MRCGRNDPEPKVDENALPTETPDLYADRLTPGPGVEK